MINSSIDASEYEWSFNDIENIDGGKLRILIGSKLISESNDFNSIRYQFSHWANAHRIFSKMSPRYYLDR